jgi:hypothetical protein
LLPELLRAGQIGLQHGQIAGEKHRRKSHLVRRVGIAFERAF